MDSRDTGVTNPMDYTHRIMVGGPRDATPSWGWFCLRMHWVLRHVSDWSDVLIIDGGARGIDNYAYRFAKQYKLAYHRCYPEWDKYERSGKKNPAGMICNRVMLKLCTLYVAFWDYQSRGTGGAIRDAVQLRIPHVVIRLPV